MSAERDLFDTIEGKAEGALKLADIITNILIQLPHDLKVDYVERFKDHLKGWKKRGYRGEIPDFAPRELENKQWVPSWRRLCRVLLRNDWWCKSLGMTQPKSDAWNKFKEMKKANG